MKMNKDWQKNADELKAMHAHDPAAAAAAEAGMQHMYGAAAAETDPKKRTTALIRAFADNCNTLADQIEATGSTAEEGIELAKAQLQFTLKHFATIEHSAKHGHQAS